MMAILCAFVFAIYASKTDNKEFVGTPDRMYEMLAKVTAITDCRYGSTCQHTLNACGPVKGNHKGSYLTMLSTVSVVNSHQSTPALQHVSAVGAPLTAVWR